MSRLPFGLNPFGSHSTLSRSRRGTAVSNAQMPDAWAPSVTTHRGACDAQTSTLAPVPGTFTLPPVQALPWRR